MPTARSNLASDFFKAVPKFFKVGGFALVFGMSGLLLIISAGVIGGAALSERELWAGCALTFVCLAYFIGDAIAKARAAAPLPVVGEVAELSALVKDISSMCQSIAFKYQGFIETSLEAVKNTAARIPFGSGIVKSIGLDRFASYSKTVVEATENVRRISTEIEVAVKNNDVETTRKYVVQLKTTVQDLRNFLAQ
jgi:hypothetical protein